VIINNYQYGENREKMVKEDRDLYLIRIVYRLNLITVNILQIPFFCHVCKFEYLSLDFLHL